MISLNKYIAESLLDDLEDLEKDSDDSIENTLIEKFLKENYSITGQYTIKDGIVDVNGSVTVTNKKLTELTNGMFVFRKIYKYFDCSGCDKLKSLKGAPKEVGGRFFCSNCDSLKSLKGAPEKVVQDFICSYCDSLTDLEGAPKKIGGSLLCHNCSALKSLKGSPKKVGGSFDCSECENLTSFEGAPEEVGRNFTCYSCDKLTSLKGAPKKVGKNFTADDCYVNGRPIDDEDIENVTDVKGKIII